jgi:hypothetical protein
MYPKEVFRWGENGVFSVPEITGSVARNFRIAGHPAAVCREAGFEVPIATLASDIFFLTSFSCHG